MGAGISALARIFSWLGTLLLLFSLLQSGSPAYAGDLPAGQSQPAKGVAIAYVLPTDGPLPRAYRVTLAITDPRDPAWIVSTFVSGAVRIVTKENQGRFTEIWNGLDDNFLPLPPGRYGVKGIYMPARKWDVDGQYHTFIPKFTVGAGDSWLPKPAQDRDYPWMWGAGVGTIADVAVGPDGKAVFYHHYIEGSPNPFVVDLNKPIGYGQIVQGYPSGGTAGGPAVATDGKLVWAVSTVGSEPDFIYRADRKPFGHGRAVRVSDVYLPVGRVTSLAAWRNPATDRPYLYAAQTGRDEAVLVLDGNDGAKLAELPLPGIRAVVAANGALYALYRPPGEGWTIGRTALRDGVPDGTWHTTIALRGIPDPTDFKIDRRGFAYVSDLAANQVYKLDRSGKILLRFGHSGPPAPGTYDDHAFLSPGKLALWTDRQGRDRLIVVERSGPSRVSEWSTDGNLLRQWFAGQVQGVFGFAVDPQDPQHFYMNPNTPASDDGLLRFHVDYATGRWRVDGFWSGICRWRGFPGGVHYPKIINYKGHKYLAYAMNSERRHQAYSYMIYRQQGRRWIPSAGIIPDPSKGKDALPAPGAAYLWHDANGDGKIEPDEYRNDPAYLPAALRFYGEVWLDDLSLLLIDESGRSIWRLAPRGFDSHGNPIYDGTKWQKLLTDPIFAARAAGTADALHGGNEIGDRFNIPWASVDGSMAKGFYVNGYSGPFWPDGTDTSGTIGAQIKISYYAPDGHGGFALKWRVGRKAYGLAKPGEIYSGLHISPPINHILGLQDGNGVYHLFTDDGLYLDTLFYDTFRGKAKEGGVYALGGEFYDGYSFLNRDDHKVYIATGRDAPSFFAVEGWTATANSFERIETLPASVTISAEQIAAAPEVALRAHGGAGTARVARFSPATGGAPALDGSMSGWERSEIVPFGFDKDRSVTVRTLYDPETIYLRWEVRLPHAVEPCDAPVLERMFTDADACDTVSFYIQGDPAAAPAKTAARPGDARIVFGLIKKADGIEPVAILLHPLTAGHGMPHPLVFFSTVGRTEFADARPLEGARLGYRIDADGKGFVLAAAIPRNELAPLPPLSAAVQTTVDFSATFGGKAEIWWANADGSASTATSDEPSEAALYPGAWAQAQFVPLTDSLPITNWLVSGPWGGPGLKTLGLTDLFALREKQAVVDFFDHARYPPDNDAYDWRATYSGPLTTDRFGAEHTVRAQAAQVRTDDQRLRLGPPAQLYFADAWVFSPKDQDIDCSFSTWQQDMVSVWVDGAPLPTRTIANAISRTPLPQKVHFRKGWNRVHVRGYAVGYDLQFGMELHGDPATLWQVGLSPLPP